MVSLSNVVLLDDGYSLGEIRDGLLDGKRVGVSDGTWSGEDSSDEGGVFVVRLFDKIKDFLSGDGGT